jgi:hypothetical protein
MRWEKQSIPPLDRRISANITIQLSNVTTSLSLLTFSKPIPAEQNACYEHLLPPRNFSFSHSLRSKLIQNYSIIALSIEELCLINQIIVQLAMLH